MDKDLDNPKKEIMLYHHFSSSNEQITPIKSSTKTLVQYYLHNDTQVMNIQCLTCQQKIDLHILSEKEIVKYRSKAKYKTILMIFALLIFGIWFGINLGYDSALIVISFTVYIFDFLNEGEPVEISIDPENLNPPVGNGWRMHELLDLDENDLKTLT